MRWLLTAVVYANNKLKRLAIRLTKWTGKSHDYVHPKHLLGDDPEQYWYLAYCRDDATVLDVGCGHGAHALRAATRARMVLGLDRDPEAIAQARWHRAWRKVRNAVFYVADCEAPLVDSPTEGYDLVLCLDLLEHVVNRDQLLSEIRRVLKPDGTLLLAVPNRATSWKRRLERAGCFAYSDPDHKIEYTLDELRRELERNGFVITRLHPSVYDTPLIGLIDLIGSLSLPLYRRITAYRRELTECYPEEAAGFYAACRVAR